MLLNSVSVNKYKTCKLLNIKDMMNNLQSSAFVAKTTQQLSSVAHLRLLLVMLLTLSVCANAWADYTITFKTSGSNTDGSNAQTNIANLISSGGGYVSTISASRAYNGKDGFGVKLGSSSSVGNVAMTLTNSGNNIGQIKASKLIVNAAYFKSGPTLKVTATYTDNTTSVQSLSLTANIAAYDVALTSTKTLKSIKIESVKGSSECRAYCHSIKVVAASAAVTTYTVTYDLNGGQAQYLHKQTLQLVVLLHLLHHQDFQKQDIVLQVGTMGQRLTKQVLLILCLQKL